MYHCPVQVSSLLCFPVFSWPKCFQYYLLLKRSLRFRSSSSTRALNWVQSSSWNCSTPRARWSSAEWLRRKGLYCLSSPTVEGHWKWRARQNAALLKVDVNSLTLAVTVIHMPFICGTELWVTSDFCQLKPARHWTSASLPQLKCCKTSHRQQ